MTHRRLKVRRMVCALAAVLLICTLIPVTAQAAGTEQATRYTWTRVYSGDQLPQDGSTFRIMLYYEGKGFADIPADFDYNDSRTMRFSHTLKAYEGAESFETLTDGSAMFMRYRKWDSDNDCPVFDIFTPNSEGGSGVSLMGQTRGYSLITGGRHDIERGFVKLFVNMPNAWDRGVRESDGQLDYKTYHTWGSKDPFILYVGVEETITTVSHKLTVAADEYRVFDGTTYIKEGEYITVEKGGVLCLSGTVYLNGGIQNYGTMIVTAGARVGPKDKQNQKGNWVENLGGTLIVLEDARLALYTLDKPTTSLFLAGGQVYNFGLILTSYMVLSRQAAVYNQTGSLFLAGLHGGAPTSSADALEAQPYLKFYGPSYEVNAAPALPNLYVDGSTCGIAVDSGGGDIYNKGWFVGTMPPTYTEAAQETYGRKGWAFLHNQDGGESAVDTQSGTIKGPDAVSDSAW